MPSTTAAGKVVTAARLGFASSSRSSCREARDDDGLGEGEADGELLLGAHIGVCRVPRSADEAQ